MSTSSVTSYWYTLAQVYVLSVTDTPILAPTCTLQEYVILIFVCTNWKFDVYLHIGHINNLNNTCIWKLVQSKGLTTAEAQQRVNVSRLSWTFQSQADCVMQEHWNL